MYTERPNISSISTAIAAFEKQKPIVEASNTSIDMYAGFRVEIANTTTKLMDAAHLAYNGYLKKSFVSESEIPFIFNEWDFTKDSVCLVVYDSSDRCVGTMTVIKDQQKLPVDITFNDELNTLRNQGHSMCECSRFIIDSECEHSREILIALTEWAYVIADYYFHYSDIIIEVNPRHQTFYVKKFFFETLTGVKNCALVNGAPAVLLRLDILEFRKKLKEATPKRVYFDFRSRQIENLEQMLAFITSETEKAQLQERLENYMDYVCVGK